MMSEPNGWADVARKQDWYDESKCVMCGATSPEPAIVISSAQDNRTVALVCSTHTLYEFVDDRRFLISFLYAPHPIKVA